MDRDRKMNDTMDLENRKDPLMYEEILMYAGWKLFQRDDNNFICANSITGRIIEIWTDHKNHKNRTEQQNANWQRSWACYQLCELLRENWTEQEITAKYLSEEFEKANS